MRGQQVRKEINLPNYDNKWLHYGFSIGVHISGYKLDYDDSFFDQVTLDSPYLHSVMPKYSPGFSLGLIANVKLADYVDLRFVPQVGFYEYFVRFNYRDGYYKDQPLSVTMVDFPLLVKFKSNRRKNTRMYFIGGVSPAIEASGKKNDESQDKKIFVTSSNLSVQFGFGLDMYFKLFKFSPEVRFSKGLSNVLRNKPGSAGDGIESLSTNVVTFYLLFE